MTDPVFEPWGAARELEPWADVRLRCAVGHRYGGRVRTVTVVERDSPHADAGKRWSTPRREFEPWKCVVCGLVTYGLDGDDHG